MATAEYSQFTPQLHAEQTHDHRQLSLSERKEILDSLHVRPLLEQLAAIVNNPLDENPDVTHLRSKLLAQTRRSDTPHFRIEDELSRSTVPSADAKPRYDFVNPVYMPVVISEDGNVSTLGSREVSYDRSFSIRVSSSGKYLNFDQDLIQDGKRVPGKCVIRSRRVSELQQGDVVRNVWQTLLSFVGDPVRPNEIYSLPKIRLTRARKAVALQQ